MDAELVGAIVAFLRAPNADPVPSHIQRLDVRRVIRGACVLRIPALVVFCVALLSQ
jgi:hypothetical protein